MNMKKIKGTTKQLKDENELIDERYRATTCCYHRDRPTTYYIISEKGSISTQQRGPDILAPMHCLLISLIHNKRKLSLTSRCLALLPELALQLNSHVKWRFKLPCKMAMKTSPSKRARALLVGLVVLIQMPPRTFKLNNQSNDSVNKT